MVVLLDRKPLLLGGFFWKLQSDRMCISIVDNTSALAANFYRAVWNADAV